MSCAVMRWPINQTLVIISYLWLQGFININKKPLKDTIFALLMYRGSSIWLFTLQRTTGMILCTFVANKSKTYTRILVDLISSVSQSVSSFFAKLCSCLCSNEPDLNLLSHINGSTSVIVKNIQEEFLRTTRQVVYGARFWPLFCLIKFMP